MPITAKQVLLDADVDTTTLAARALRAYRRMVEGNS
jgi:hypothetical protein